MAGELTEFADRISKITDPAALSRVRGKAGYAGKRAGLDTVASDLGGDRAFSGFGRRVSAGIGYDEIGSTTVLLKFRPAGIWKLADTGRRGGKTIVSRRGLGGAGSGHAPAVRTPDGWRRSATLGEWGGKGTLKAAVAKARVEVPKAAFKQFQAEVARVVK